MPYLEPAWVGSKSFGNYSMPPRRVTIHLKIKNIIVGEHESHVVAARGLTDDGQALDLERAVSDGFRFESAISTGQARSAQV
jgi:hypothetical protein